MSHCGVLEIAFGHCSSWGEGPGLGTEVTYLGAALALSAPAVPCPQLGTQPRCYRCSCRGPRQAAREQGGSRTSLLCPEVDPEGTQLFCRGRDPTPSHTGCKIKVAACFWQSLLKLVLLHSITLCLRQLSPEFIIRRFRCFESFPLD